jgi:hypothetical protein
VDGGDKMRGIILILAILGSLPTLTAQTTGLEYLQVTDGSVSRIDTRVEFTIENWGLDRIFITPPEGWKISDTALLDGTHSLGGTAFSVRLYPYHYWNLWGFPYESNTPMGRGEIFTSKTSQDVVFSEIAGKEGWYIKPNEAIKVIFDVKAIPTTGGIIDPLKLEKENPDIRVVKWHQTFIMNVSKQGFITAPWVVMGANLTEAIPAPYSDAKGRGSLNYYVDFETTVNTPKWGDWVEISQPLSSVLISRVLGATGMKLPEVKKINLIKPVFKVSNNRLIYYTYEWERDKVIEGWTPWRNDFINIPRWDKWF